MLNGINISALSEFVHEIRDDAREARYQVGISLNWVNGTKMAVKTKTATLGTHRVVRSFELPMDEPRQLLGLNSAANPQEYLLASVSGCMAVIYVVGASMMGIHLEKLTIEIDGELDLRGFLGLGADVGVPLQNLSYTIRVKGDGTQEQYEALHDRVIRYSPNFNTVIAPNTMAANLVIEDR